MLEEYQSVWGKPRSLEIWMAVCARDRAADHSRRSTWLIASHIRICSGKGCASCSGGNSTAPREAIAARGSHRPLLTADVPATRGGRALMLYRVGHVLLARLGVLERPGLVGENSVRARRLGDQPKEDQGLFHGR